MPPRVGSFILASACCLCCRMVSSFSCPCLMRCRRAVFGVIFLVVVIVFSFLVCLFVWVLIKREGPALDSRQCGQRNRSCCG